MQANALAVHTHIKIMQWFAWLHNVGTAYYTFLHISGHTHARARMHSQSLATHSKSSPLQSGCHKMQWNKCSSSPLMLHKAILSPVSVLIGPWLFAFFFFVFKVEVEGEGFYTVGQGDMRPLVPHPTLIYNLWPPAASHPSVPCFQENWINTVWKWLKNVSQYHLHTHRQTNEHTQSFFGHWLLLIETESCLWKACDKSVCVTGCVLLPAIRALLTDQRGQGFAAGTPRYTLQCGSVCGCLFVACLTNCRIHSRSVRCMPFQMVLSM